MAEMAVIKISCGSVRGNLHKNKFYCPGIHRECIEFENEFITPKTFSVMGDKEKLKDWKNAIRINGIQVRKYIESGTLDFYRHDEFCTGRCIARSPLNRQLPTVSTTSDLKVEFVSSINEHTYCHLRDDSVGAGLSLPTVELAGEPTPVDVKPNAALLQSLLERPMSSVDVVPADVAAVLANQTFLAEEEPVEYDTESAEEDRQFWLGIMELGLLEHFFREIRIMLDSFKSDLVAFHVRPKDAVRVSSIVRTLGLMKRFKCRLSSFKSDMDLQQVKIDAEMAALKKKVTQYELRKEALKRKSEKFELLMDISSDKKFIIEKNDNSDVENVGAGHGGDDDDDDGDSVMDEVNVYMEDSEDDIEDDDLKHAFQYVDEGQKETICEKQVSVPTAVPGTIAATAATTTAVAAPTNSAVAVPRTVAVPRRGTNTPTTTGEPANGARTVARPSVGVTSTVVRPTASPNKKTIKVTAINRPLSPLNITTLPADSISNYILKKTTVDPPTPTYSPADGKKVTIIRQVLMDTGGDGDAMERIKKAAANSLKELSSPVSAARVATMSDSAAFKPSKMEPAKPSKTDSSGPKEKIRIIARCKSKFDTSSPVVKTTTPHTQNSHTETPSAMLTFNPVTNSLCTVSQCPSTLKSLTANPTKCNEIDRIKASAIPQVVPGDIKKKRRMGPKCKTIFSVDMLGAGRIPTCSDDSDKVTIEGGDSDKVTIESGCQTPIDGVRESGPNPAEIIRERTAVIGSREKLTPARRSNRKTTHMFSWGVKEGGGDSHDTKDFTPEELLNFSYDESSSLENV